MCFDPNSVSDLGNKINMAMKGNWNFISTENSNPPEPFASNWKELLKKIIVQ
ncbi:MAG: hypothetical protein ACI9QN_001676 [Arcticibacterium sp.]|jgi:hypothetical protein